jgi:pimeloyl-ACP methyl ester carboxylesterase
MTAPGQPHLNRLDPPGPVRGVVLMLHGGAVAGTRPVDRRSGAYRRSAVMRNSIAPSLLTDGWAVDLLRFGIKGWNHQQDQLPPPVQDARWALSRIQEWYGATPVILVGHSMGGRTAFHVADDENVIGVVALAPWCERTDPVAGLVGKQLIALHGQSDRVTNPLYTRKFIDRAAQAGVSASFVDMGPLGHYLIRGARSWNEHTLNSVRSMTQRG